MDKKHDKKVGCGIRGIKNEFFFKLQAKMTFHSPKV